MRSITLALVVAFATATRLTALDASLTAATKETTIKTADVKDIKIDKPIDIKPPGEIKKEATLEESEEKGSKSVGCAQSQIVCQEY